MPDGIRTRWDPTPFHGAPISFDLGCPVFPVVACPPTASHCPANWRSTAVRARACRRMPRASCCLPCGRHGNCAGTADGHGRDCVQAAPGGVRTELRCPRSEFADAHVRRAYSLTFSDCPQLTLTQPHPVLAAAQSHDNLNRTVCRSLRILAVLNIRLCLLRPSRKHFTCCRCTSVGTPPLRPSP